MAAAVLLVDGRGLRYGRDAHEKVVFGVLEGARCHARGLRRRCIGINRGVNPDAPGMLCAVGAILFPRTEKVFPRGGGVGVGELGRARYRGIVFILRVIGG